MSTDLPLESLIRAIRGQKVLLDSDLAAIYGVPTKRLNEQVKRNAARFPQDFMFQLKAEEWRILKSQIVIPSSECTENQSDARNRSQIATGYQRHRDPRLLPYAFTEHGALMAANVLNSPEAVKMSVHVVRAFIKQRELLAGQTEILKKLAQMDAKLLKHDDALRVIWRELQPLLAPPRRPAPAGAHVRPEWRGLAEHARLRRQPPGHEKPPGFEKTREVVQCRWISRRSVGLYRSPARDETGVPGQRGPEGLPR